MKRAETIAEVGVLPLSRRDRAALELALEAMRVRVHAREMRIADELAGDAIEVARYALKCASSWCVAGELCAWLRYAQRRVSPRLLRARLALALRVLLRVNRGDYGPEADRPCAECGLDYPSHLFMCGGRHRPFARLPVHPLWQDAPACDGRSAKERREGLAISFKRVEASDAR